MARTMWALWTRAMNKILCATVFHAAGYLFVSQAEFTYLRVPNIGFMPLNRVSHPYRLFLVSCSSLLDKLLTSLLIRRAGTPTLSPMGLRGSHKPECRMCNKITASKPTARGFSNAAAVAPPSRPGTQGQDHQDYSGAQIKQTQYKKILIVRTYQKKFETRCHCL